MNDKDSFKIYMVTHGPVCSFIPEGCCPIEVGAADRKNFTYEIRDNTGEHISERNKVFNEMTGLYWMWKNDKSEVIGLYHYRRILDITPEKALKALETVDIIIPKRIKIQESVKEQYCRYHPGKDFDIFEETLKQMYPAYSESFDRFKQMDEMNICNMFISKKKLIDEYCEWAFPLYEQLICRIDLNGREPYQKRLIGFLSERCFALYILHNNLKTREIKMKYINYDSKLEQFKNNYVPAWVKGVIMRIGWVKGDLL